MTGHSTARMLALVCIRLLGAQRGDRALHRHAVRRRQHHQGRDQRLRDWLAGLAALVLFADYAHSQAVARAHAGTERRPREIRARTNPEPLLNK